MGVERGMNNCANKAVCTNSHLRKVFSHLFTVNVHKNINDWLHGNQLSLLCRMSKINTELYCF